MTLYLDELHDARRRTLSLVLDLDDEQWVGAPLAIANPIFWEIAHIAWFQDTWISRRARKHEPILAGADAVYDSAKIPQARRWYLAFPSRERTLGYLSDVLERSTEAIKDGEHSYFTELALYHEDMHCEALTYTRQTRAWPEAYGTSHLETAISDRGALLGDVEVPGGRYMLGAAHDTGWFVFDNEKWAHPTDVETFRIARAPVTNAEFADFVDAGGYDEEAYWSDRGREHFRTTRAQAPVYWEKRAGEWFVRRYDRFEALFPHHPVVHVSWFEAEAYCRWAKRRLPTEAEWEVAASSYAKRRFPWGDAEPTVRLANVHGVANALVDVRAHAAGDSVYGCRQMIGNVWEWTASRFLPYPGFVVDPYAEYSTPWFASPHMVLRGGSWATPGRLLRNTWRNFFPPERRDIFAGFRTCALA